MKLIRFGTPGAEKPGVLLDHGTRIDVSGFGRDYDEAFLGGGELADLVRWFEANRETLPRVDHSVRLGPPICRPSKIICIGLNYRDHAEESGMELPEEPVVFFKATSSIVGPNDPVVIPRNASKVDWEVELAVVIGKRAKYVDEANAMEHVAGYMLHNDYSEREFQLERGGQWVKGKSADTFAPLGPFFASRNEIADPDNLRLWLKVNGKTMQEGHTSNMAFGVAYLVSYLSQFMTLLPGDVISTGTPAGVGLGLDPPTYLQPGDVVELGIDGLGQAKQEVVREEGSDENGKAP
jgi:2-keto-4-pentenoate hydratase/2-oxohepta-3-ene-1,7-dioic acid hydratase in catechol pathway